MKLVCLTKYNAGRVIHVSSGSAVDFNSIIISSAICRDLLAQEDPWDQKERRCVNDMNVTLING